jgi:hypothetical protein
MNFDEIVLEALNDGWVIILEFTKVGSDYEEGTKSEITYTMKKVKDLTPEELEKIKTLDRLKVLLDIKQHSAGQVMTVFLSWPSLIQKRK